MEDDGGRCLPLVRTRIFEASPGFPNGPLGPLARLIR